METKTKALVLSITPFREKDAIVEFLCESDGRCSAMARGFFTSRKRFGFAVDYFNLLNLGMKKGRSSMYTLSWAETLKTFADLRTSLEHGACAMMVLGVVRTVAMDAPDSPCGFARVTDTLDRLNHGQEPWSTGIKGILEYLDCHGFPLIGAACAGCGRTMAEPAGISAHGRPMCSSCCGMGCKRVSTDFMNFIRGEGDANPDIALKDLEFFVQGITERRIDLHRFLEIQRG